MARQDQITLKKAMSGNYRSHALNSTRRKFRKQQKSNIFSFC